MSRGRRLALATVTALLVLGAVGYLALAALQPSPVSTDATPRAAGGAGLTGAQLIVRAVDREDPRLNGRVFAIGGGRPQELAGGELECARVYFNGGRGLCLATGESGVGYEATILDAELRPSGEVGLAGLPSRARVSDDGRYGAMTVFVNGHEYLGAGGFSTATTIVDMEKGEELANLESFEVVRDGERIESVDFNFWGITFDPEDSDHFYATLRTDGHHYLVEGSVRERRVEVIRDGVECPSLSPDGTRIAFKSRLGDEDRWRIAVLDLKTLRDHRVAETDSIDDQPEWLSNSALVYSDGLDVYTVNADGSGTPRLVVRNASSPVSLNPNGA